MKKKILIGIGLMITILSLIGISYAAWTITKEQTGMNKIKSSCFKLSLEKEENIIGLKNTFPITDEEGMNLTPYTFRVTNTCDLFASYTVSLEILKGSTMPISYIKVLINNEKIENLNEFESTEKVESDSIDSKVLMRGTLGSGDSDDYNLRLWMDEKVTTSMEGSMNTSLKAKIVITGSVSNYNPVDAGITKLNDAILANEYQTSVEIAKEKIHNKQTPDFSKTAPLIDWKENHTTTLATRTATMPHPDKVGEYDGFTNINQSYVRMANSYTFNKETGYYELVDSFLIDPTIIADYGTKDYYFIEGYTSISDSDRISVVQSSRHTNLYKITEATKENTTQTGPNGTIFEMSKYIMKGYLYTQNELASDKSDKGLYESVDDYGTSYYYRGSVKNNNVYFGGFYWQIIRINGDGSIRLLYNGSVSNATGSSKQIGTSAFNSTSNHPGYVGYKYGNVNGNSIDEIYANENSSTIKTTLDSWYRSNIIDKNLSSYIADSGFCNDRSITIGDGISTTASTNYGAYQRYSQNKSPSLVCPNKERDLFTTSTSSVGNQALEHPVGLITVDEVGLAGMSHTYLNRLTYVYSENSYWTFSPNAFNANSSAASVYFVYNGNYVNSTKVVYSQGVRPVINLSSDVEITKGVGTTSNPFVVKVD